MAISFWESLGYSSPGISLLAWKFGAALQDPLAPYFPPWFSQSLPMLVISLCFGLVYWFSPPAPKKTMAKPGEEAPDFQIEVLDGKGTRLDGKRSRLHELRNEKDKPMFVAFVQRCLGDDENELCPHCPVVAMEMEELAKGKYKDKVTFLIVNIKSKQDAKAFRNHKSWKNSDACIHGWLDTAARIDVMKLYQVKSVPNMFVMDKDGVLYQYGLGKEGVGDVLDEFFKAGAKALALDNVSAKKEK